MSDDRIPLLVLGLGNVLCGDDGVGVVAVHALRRRYQLAPGAVALDGGTLGLALLPLVERADRVILLDAIRADAPVGAPVRLRGDEVAAAVRERLSPHQIGVADLLAGAAWLDRYPTEVVLLGVVPAALELGNALTPAVAAAIPALVEAAAAELAAQGFPPELRPAGLALDEEGDRAAVALGL